ncbi:hypothetical protein DWF00_02065 [Bosea caraganae]|uniref:Mll5186 protein n=1 Tax=Bosea caraganae TaxID=2763117 RepID=A0A370KXG5_9HYPH|nr:hypothetical protein DWE98_28800 [Bosea caraganae]RDJ30490.1 hypothetical protein DWF00_02065 [Bosea caraganae]
MAAATSTKSAQSYLEWGAIFGGAVLAAAISTIMTAFGSAIGLTLVSPEPGRSTSLTVIAIVAGLWALWIAVSAATAGGYLAGRMRRPVADASAHERDVRDGAHGLVVWAVGALLVTVLTTSSLFGAARTAAEGVASATSGAASLLSQQADPMANALDSVMRSTGTAPVTSDERAEASRIFVTGLSTGKLESGGREYIASRLASRAGIAQPDAEKRIDDAFAKLTQAKETAKQAVEKARKMAVLTAFLTAAVLLVSAAASWMGAMLGGKHRDEELDLSHLIRRG